MDVSWADIAEDGGANVFGMGKDTDSSPAPQHSLKTELKMMADDSRDGLNLSFRTAVAMDDSEAKPQASVPPLHRGHSAPSSNAWKSINLSDLFGAARGAMPAGGSPAVPPSDKAAQPAPVPGSAQNAAKAAASSDGASAPPSARARAGSMDMAPPAVLRKRGIIEMLNPSSAKPAASAARVAHKPSLAPTSPWGKPRPAAAPVAPSEADRATVPAPKQERGEKQRRVGGSPGRPASLSVPVSPKASPSSLPPKCTWASPTGSRTPASSAPSPSQSPIATTAAAAPATPAPPTPPTLRATQSAWARPATKPDVAAAAAATAGSGAGAGASAEATEEDMPVEKAESTDEAPATPSGPPTPVPIEELTPARLEKRQRQIDIGKSTVGYAEYLKKVPKNRRQARRQDHPRTPDITLKCSKRSWDGQVRKWRRLLHLWDPKPEEGEAGTAPSSPKLRRSVSMPSSPAK